MFYMCSLFNNANLNNTIFSENGPKLAKIKAQLSKTI